MTKDYLVWAYRESQRTNQSAQSHAHGRFSRAPKEFCRGVVFSNNFNVLDNKQCRSQINTFFVTEGSAQGWIFQNLQPPLSKNKTRDRKLGL